MASDNEPAKLLLPYLQRADELQKHEPLVAYYCRLYAMEKGLRIPQSERTKTTNSLLVSLMKQLEKDKKMLKLGPEDHLHLEGFALNVFGKADKQDRAGRADLNTAKTFYAASIFFEIINQFGELQPDLEQKQKYAVWKAADIRKALKEGRKPIPGPPNGDEDLSIPSATSGVAYDLGQHEPAVTSPRQMSSTSPQFHDEVNNQRYIPPQSQFHDKFDGQHSSNISPSPPSFPSDGYPTHDLSSSHQHEPQRDFHQPFYQPYRQDLPPHMPVNYPPHESSASYSFANFQSYPSFTESSLPTASSHYPSSYQGSETPYNPPQSAPSHYPSSYQGSETPYNPPQSAPPTTSYPSTTAQYSSSSRNGKIAEPSPPTSEKYQYDSNYQPPPEKIAEAHKAARFAVGALAFDEVSTAVEHLKKSLELLTNPSASHKC